MELTPSKTSLFGSLSRPKGKGSSGRSKAPVRPPPGFVSYQIPNGCVPATLPPSDNIVYESRCYMGSSRNGRAKNGDPPLAGIHPNNLHNGGRAHPAVGLGHPVGPLRPSPREQEEDRQADQLLESQHSRVAEASPGGYQPPPWADRGGSGEGPKDPGEVGEGSRCPGEGGKRYPRSPAITPHLWAKDVEDMDQDNDVESMRTLSSNSPDYAVNGSKPPLPDGIPKPPPRSRPRSWTSTLYHAIKNSGSKTLQHGLPHQQSMGMVRDPSSLTLASMRTGDLGRSGRQKSVRFLANPSRIGPPQKFYSLPRFIQQPLIDKSTNGSEGVKVKARSRTPSPFTRFVKSLVKGKPHWCVIR